MAIDNVIYKEAYHGSSWSPMKPEDAFIEGVSVVVKDNSNEVATELKEREQSCPYVILGDDIWVKSGEPFYRVSTFGLGHNHGGTAFGIEYASIPDIYEMTKYEFNALERDAAIVFGLEVARNRGDDKSTPDFGDGYNIDVLMPEAVKMRHKSNSNKDMDAFKEKLDAIIDQSSSVAEAGFAVIAATLKEINK